MQPFKNKSSRTYPRALLPAIVHDYFLYRGVPGSADLIPSASEPVLFSTISIYNIIKKSMVKLHKKILERLHFRSRLLYFIRYICHVIPFFHTTKK